MNALPPTSVSLEEAAHLIQSKQKPLLICGGGVRYSEAHNDFVQFAEAYGIPFGETQAGKSAVVANHPLNVGGIGTTGGLAANLLAKEADLVIGVGTRFTDFTTASKSLFSKEGVRFLNINVAEFDASKLDALKVVADAKEALQALDAKMKGSGYQYQWGHEIQLAKQQWKNELDRLFSIQYLSWILSQKLHTTLMINLKNTVKHSALNLRKLGF